MESSAPSGSKISPTLSNSSEKGQNQEQGNLETSVGPEKEANDEDENPKDKNKKSPCLDLSSSSWEESKSESRNDTTDTSNLKNPSTKSEQQISTAEKQAKQKLGDANKKREIQMQSKISEISDAIKLALITLTDEDKNNSNSEVIQKILEKKIYYSSLAHKIAKDPVKHICTDLIRLQNIPRFLNLKCQLWVKCEFQNIRSGSSKDRVVAMILEDLESSGKIIPNETTIITHTSAVFTMALAIANIRQGKKYEIISILSDRISKFKSTLLNHINVKVIRAPEEASESRVSKDCPTVMAKFLATKIRKSYIIDPFEDPLSWETHYWWTGPELLTQFDDKIDMLVCGYETGGMITGMARLLKTVNEDCVVIGADMSGQLANPNESYRYDPDTVFVEDFASPTLSSVLNPAAADKWYPVPIKQAVLKSRELMLKEGIPVSASSGGVLEAALNAIRDYGLGDVEDAKIVLVMDNFVLYTDFEFGCNEWLVNNNYLTHEDIESTVWFHQIRIWRIPVKIPVTIFTEFNAFAVYSMMTKNRIGRVVVQDSETKTILGVASYQLIQQHIWNGTINSKTCIGESSALCKSFKTISIHCNVGSLLELLKTHSYAVLVQKQNVCSIQGQREEEWLAGILNFEEIVHFITDLEQKHSEKFGANLAGGFCRPMPTSLTNRINSKQNTTDSHRPSQIKLRSSSDSDNSNPTCSDKCSLNSELTNLAQSIAPCFTESIVMNTSIPPSPIRSHRPRTSTSMYSPHGSHPHLSAYALTSSDSFIAVLNDGTVPDHGELEQHYIPSPGDSSAEQIPHSPSEPFISAVEFRSTMNTNQSAWEYRADQQTSLIVTNGPNVTPNSLPHQDPQPSNSIVVEVPGASQVATAQSSANEPGVSPALNAGVVNEKLAELTTIYATDLVEIKSLTDEHAEAGASLERPAENPQSQSKPLAHFPLFSAVVSQPFTPFQSTDVLQIETTTNGLSSTNDINTRSKPNASSEDLMSMDSKLILSTAGSSSTIQIDTESGSPSATDSGIEVPFEYSSVRVNDLIIQAMYSGAVASGVTLNNEHNSNALLPIEIDPSAAISNSSSYNFIETTNSVLLAKTSDPIVTTPAPARLEGQLPVRAAKPGTAADTALLDKSLNPNNPGSSLLEKSKLPSAPLPASAVAPMDPIKGNQEEQSEHPQGSNHTNSKDNTK